MAPYFHRMMVLDHYRNFKVPKTKTYSNWNEWCHNVIRHPAVKKTFMGRSLLIWSHKSYADCTVRNAHYYRFYESGPHWLK